jgi:hypothetical protein
MAISHLLSLDHLLRRRRFYCEQPASLRRIGVGLPQGGWLGPYRNHLFEPQKYGHDA